jgi:hypothetical protein
LSSTFTRQGFEAIARQNGKVPQAGGRLKPVKLHSRLPLDSREGRHPLTVSEVPRAPVSIADDHL